MLALPRSSLATSANQRSFTMAKKQEKKLTEEMKGLSVGGRKEAKAPPTETHSQRSRREKDDAERRVRRHWFVNLQFQMN